MPKATSLATLPVSGLYQSRLRSEPFTGNQWRDKFDSWLALCPDAPVHSLKELVAFNEVHPDQAMPEGK